MIAILKRDCLSYFVSPFGYVFIAAYYLFGGYFFFDYNLYGNTPDMRGVFGAMFIVTVFLMPILTMRIFAEEHKMKTSQIFYMSPVSLTEVVIGKFLAAFSVYLMALSVLLIEAVVISQFGEPEWSVIAGHFIGLILLGASMIAIGMFISSNTENQIIAAIGTFCACIFLIIIESLAQISTNPIVTGIIKFISFETRYSSFTLGVMNLQDIMFFLSITELFIFFTVVSLEKRRYV